MRATAHTVGCMRPAPSHYSLGRCLGRPFTLVTFALQLVGSTFTMSEGDSSFAVGNALDPATSTFLTLNQTAACNPPTTSASLCGVWSMTCTHTNDHPDVQAKSAAFSYDGPASALMEAGVYDRITTWFKDTDCTVPYLSISIPPGGGTFMQDGESGAIPGGYKGIERPLYVNVTAIDVTALDNLRNDCPCGNPDQWTLGSPRQITSCPDPCRTWW